MVGEGRGYHRPSLGRCGLAAQLAQQLADAGTGFTQKDLMALEQWIEAEIANQPEKKSEYEENSK